MSDPFPEFYAALEKRHLASLTFAEVRKGVQALSSLYVERREKLPGGAALDGAGKRAAFALFYGPLHLLTVREIVRGLGCGTRTPLIDLGCGTLSAGAGWALASAESGAAPELLGVERNRWAAGEARFTLAALRLRGRVVRDDVRHVKLPPRPGALVAAFTANELDAEARPRLLEQLLASAAAGAKLLVVEPISKRSAPWWPEWAASFRERGGREDEWRFRLDLPERLRLLDKAAGLDHREQPARSLYLG